MGDVEGDLPKDMGASFGPGSREPSPSVSAASGFDPSRGIRFTVGFVIRDDAAFDEFWSVLMTQYAYRDEAAPVRAFAFSKGDMFAEQDAIDTALGSDLDAYDLREFLSNVPCCEDLSGLLAEWGIARDSDGSGEAGETAQTGSTVGDSAGRKASPKDTHHDQ